MANHDSTLRDLEASLDFRLEQSAYHARAMGKAIRDVRQRTTPDQFSSWIAGLNLDQEAAEALASVWPDTPTSVASQIVLDALFPDVEP